MPRSLGSSVCPRHPQNVQDRAGACEECRKAVDLSDIRMNSRRSTSTYRRCGRRRDAERQCRARDPGSVRGVCRTVGPVAEGRRPYRSLRAARTSARAPRPQRRPAARLAPVADLGQRALRGEEVADRRQLRGAGGPGCAPLQLARDDVARDPGRRPPWSRSRGARPTSSATAAAARSARPCGGSRAQIETGASRASRSGELDRRLGVRRLDHDAARARRRASGSAGRRADHEHGRAGEAGRPTSRARSRRCRCRGRAGRPPAARTRAASSASTSPGTASRDHHEPPRRGRVAAEARPQRGLDHALARRAREHEQRPATTRTAAGR